MAGVEGDVRLLTQKVGIWVYPSAVLANRKSPRARMETKSKGSRNGTPTSELMSLGWSQMGSGGLVWRLGGEGERE